MLLLIPFAFLAGVVTILSPCILPILPVVLSGTVGDKKKPFGIVAGFIISFTFFTLFLAGLVRFLNISADLLRSFSVLVISLFGVSLLLPGYQKVLERLFAKLSGFAPKNKGKTGFWGGVIVGVSIGLLWTPCVGPILASVISLAITGTVTKEAFIITLAYSLGTAIPMLMIIYGGRKVLEKVPVLAKNANKIQQMFGVLMIVTAIAIYFNLDRKFQTYILDKFPGYGAGLIKLEDNEGVKKRLYNLNNRGLDKNGLGKNLADVMEENLIKAPELFMGGVWFNLPSGTSSLVLQDLRGKVVLVDFWTYTCINCIRTLPYLQNWHEKYKNVGFVLIGVHTPEFEFEKSPENVAKAISDFGLTYPVMQDNNFATWNAYANRYWPAKYLIDKNGKIRYTHFGEGNYDETEEKIQELLSEGGDKISLEIENPDYKIASRTPELYLGYKRMGYNAEPEQVALNTKKSYTLPADLALHHFAFGGDWKVEAESSEAFNGSEMVLGFESKDVFLVMRPKENGQTGQVKVYLDGKPVSKDVSGEDVLDASLTVNKDRLYKLINLEKPGQHILRLEFLDNNTEVFAFTFG